MILQYYVKISMKLKNNIFSKVVLYMYWKTQHKELKKKIKFSISKS